MCKAIEDFLQINKRAMHWGEGGTELQPQIQKISHDSLTIGSKPIIIQGRKWLQRATLLFFSINRVY